MVGTHALNIIHMRCVDVVVCLQHSISGLVTSAVCTSDPWCQAIWKEGCLFKGF